jgi:hypothetical protein
MEVLRAEAAPGHKGRKKVHNHPQELFEGRQGDFPMEAFGGDLKKWGASGLS